MTNQILADAVLILHFAFVAFVFGGALLLLRWRKLVWVHVPAALWGAVVEFTGWICPLTPLENRLRERAGRVGYSGDFVGHYLLPVIYPESLTARVQLVLGLLVVGVNVALYAVVIARSRRSRAKGSSREFPFAGEGR
ncbi:MAG TPA: DUF2784 domain-containing protein [Thermoanaerobaculia bacterium]|nr:DUF2784 domain-containing protein [Thermoanaerobaculia bacterium]